jgi:hypothetical protein
VAALKGRIQGDEKWEVREQWIEERHDAFRHYKGKKGRGREMGELHSVCDNL